MSSKYCSYCYNKMPKESLYAHIQRKHEEMLVMVECDYCRNSMPRKSIEKHQKKLHSLECLYCGHDVVASSFEEHLCDEHAEIYRELKLIRKASFEEGKRQCLERFYAVCTVCEANMLKTSLDEHMKEVHPPQKSVPIPFVQPNLKQVPRITSVAVLYRNERTADVFFVFENHPRVAAHKCILASDSVVFCRMFYGEMKEMGDITITDASLDGFLAFLKSFYTSNMAITEENVAEIMYLGNKYDAVKCKTACQNFLTLVLCTENVLTILELTNMYNCEPLRMLCLKKIMQEGRAIIQMDCFYQSNRDVLKQILSTNFQRRNELTLFDACIGWAKQLCERENTDDLRLQLWVTVLT